MSSDLENLVTGKQEQVANNEGDCYNYFKVVAMELREWWEKSKWIVMGSIWTMEYSMT